MASTPRSTRGNASPTADRLAARAEKGQLRRQAMQDGGEVYSGEAASRSLKALGARAMTIDRSIVVAEDFDPNKVEDQALYAHEKVHLEGSGGEDTNIGRDAEELAARAAERMVLHRARAGSGGATGDKGGSAPGGLAAAGGGQGGGVNASGDKSPSHETNEAQRGYAALRAQGWTHDAIVDRLAREVVDALDARREVRNDRMGDRKGFA